MDILFRSRKLQEDCCDSKRAVKRWGSNQAKLMRRRLDELRAAETLEDMRTLPQTRCHELIGDYEGQLSLDLIHPQRLLIEPADDPIPCKKDGGLDWSRVRTIRILTIEDTHG